MNRFLYGKSATYRGYLIIPFVFYRLNALDIYSYCLLSERGNKDKLHKQTNPAKLYSSSLTTILNIAIEHLKQQVNYVGDVNFFKLRYTYDNNLIILHQEEDKWTYEHYPPTQLQNIAAPKRFKDRFECLNWLKEGLKYDRVS
jgi:hypothetical protein